MLVLGTPTFANTHLKSNFIIEFLNNKSKQKLRNMSVDKHTDSLKLSRYKTIALNV